VATVYDDHEQEIHREIHQPLWSVAPNQVIELKRAEIIDYHLSGFGGMCQYKRDEANILRVNFAYDPAENANLACSRRGIIRGRLSWILLNITLVPANR
jgi:hypothetical protein